MKLYRIEDDKGRCTQIVDVVDKDSLIKALREPHSTIDSMRFRGSVWNFLESDCICCRCDTEPGGILKAFGDKIPFGYVDYRDGTSLVYVPIKNVFNEGELDDRKRDVKAILDKAGIHHEVKETIDPFKDAIVLDLVTVGFHEKKTRKKTSTEEKPKEDDSPKRKKTSLKKGKMDSNGVYRPTIEECDAPIIETGLNHYELEEKTTSIVMDNGTDNGTFLKFMSLDSKASAEERLTIWNGACASYLSAMESGFYDGEEFVAPTERLDNMEWKTIQEDIDKLFPKGIQSQFQSDKFQDFLQGELIYTEGRGYGKFNGSYFDFHKPNVEFSLAQAFATKQLETSQRAMLNRKAALKTRGLSIEDVELYKKYKPKDREEAVRSGELKPVSEVDIKVYEQYKWGESLEAMAMDNHRRRPKEDIIIETRPHIVVDAVDLDKDIYLINTPCGVYDLRSESKEPRPATKDDLFTCITALEPKETPEGKKMWQDHLYTVFDGDLELMHYFQVAMGMGATGSVSAEQMFFLLGTGANGKTSTLSAIERSLGRDYVGELASNVLQKGYFDTSKFIASNSLVGKRFVHAMEIQPGASLDIEMMKQLNSTGTMVGEQKMQPQFTFTKTGSVYYETNSFPFLASEDPGVTRRIRVIPFNHKFRTDYNNQEESDNNTTKDDKSYKDRLFEVAGTSILAWLLDGAREGIRIKFDLDSIMPESVRTATDESLDDAQEQDGLQPFLDQWVIVEEGLVVRRSEFYLAYTQFMSRNHISNSKLSSRKFGARLMERGFGKKKAHGDWVIVGAELKPQEERNNSLTNEPIY